MTTSLLPATRTALVDLLKDHANLAGVTVARNLPTGDVLPRELVHIASTSTGSHEFATLRAGRKTRNESFTLTVVFDTILAASTDPEEAEARVFEMFAALEDVIADDPSLGMEHTLRAGIGEWRVIADHAERGTAAHLEADVNVEARLT